MGEVDAPLYMQPSKRITKHESIWVHFLCAILLETPSLFGNTMTLHNQPWKFTNGLIHHYTKQSKAPTIHIYVDSPLNLSMDAWVRLVHYCISNQARGSHPCWPYNIQRMYHGWMDAHWSTFILCLGWCMMYNALQPSIHVLTPLSMVRVKWCMGEVDK